MDVIIQITVTDMARSPVEPGFTHLLQDGLLLKGLEDKADPLAPKDVARLRKEVLALIDRLLPAEKHGRGETVTIKRTPSPNDPIAMNLQA